MNNDVTVIIRSTGERTLSYCRKLITLQVPEEQVNIIEETPHPAALKKCLETGIEQGRKWTLLIDADVLITNDVVGTMLQFAESAVENLLVIQGVVLDKFFPIKRPAGNHIYRTALLKKAVELIPTHGTSLRPESDMMEAMAENGYPWQQVDFILGLHDFRQYYRDIYKKCFLQAHKHARYISIVESYWEEKQTYDKDFKVALAGLKAGREYNGKVFVDREFWDSETKDALNLMQIEEKKPLVEEELSASSLDKIIKKQRAVAFWNRELQKKMFPPKSWDKIHGIENKKKSGIFAKAGRAFNKIIS